MLAPTWPGSRLAGRLLWQRREPHVISVPEQAGGATTTESVNLYEAPVLGFYRVVASVFWGGLIQVLAGISGGSGGLLTKRSGWAA